MPVHLWPKYWKNEWWWWQVKIVCVKANGLLFPWHTIALMIHYPLSHLCIKQDIRRIRRYPKINQLLFRLNKTIAQQKQKNHQEPRAYYIDKLLFEKGRHMKALNYQQKNRWHWKVACWRGIFLYGTLLSTRQIPLIEEATSLFGNVRMTNAKKKGWKKWFTQSYEKRWKLTNDSQTSTLSSKKIWKSSYYGHIEEAREPRETGRQVNINK